MNFYFNQYTFQLQNIFFKRLPSIHLYLSVFNHNFLEF
jgi:hypothetical protein